jgi:hypothetical protein
MCTGLDLVYSTPIYMFSIIVHIVKVKVSSRFCSPPL